MMSNIPLPTQTCDKPCDIDTMTGSGYLFDNLVKIDQYFQYWSVLFNWRSSWKYCLLTNYVSNTKSDITE